MPLGIQGCSGGAHSQMNSYMKTLLRSISAWGKTPIHDCPHSSQVSGGRLQPKYNHERKQISSEVNSWNCKVLSTCLTLAKHWSTQCSLSPVVFRCTLCAVQVAGAFPLQLNVNSQAATPICWLFSQLIDWVQEDIIKCVVLSNQQ